MVFVRPPAKLLSINKLDIVNFTMQTLQRKLDNVNITTELITFADYNRVSPEY